MTDKGGRKAIFLSAELYGKIEDRVKSSEFSSVEEYVIFVMEEVVREEEEERAFSKDEEEEVKKRLKALGYLE
ncbi:CopG family transcriptional regulator [Chloroflexota bacterium]